MMLMLNVLMVCLCAPLMPGFIRFFKARMQNRKGAPVYIPYIQMLSLLKKEETITRHSSWVFRFVPLIVFSSALFLTVAIPSLFNVTLSSVDNVFIVASVLALGSSFLVMGGMDTGSTFGNMGSSREMTLAALIEPAVFVSIAILAVLSGATHFGALADVPMLASTYAPLLLLVLGMSYVVLLENARYPVDNPATHLELTMVHEAMLLEYSGPSLALLEYASALKLTLMSVLSLTFLLPPFGSITTAMIPVALGFFLLKLVLSAVVIAGIETAVVKMRFYRMQEYVGIAYFIAVAGLIAVFIL